LTLSAQVEVEKLRRENDSLQNAIDTFEVAFEYKDQEMQELEKQIAEFNQEMDDLAS
jgi:predicted  nucleic acid-binding Zn-ribbon protein